MAEAITQLQGKSWLDGSSGSIQTLPIKTTTYRFAFCLTAIFFLARCSILAQQPKDSAMAINANFSFYKLFGTNSCTARCEVRILNDSFKESFTEYFEQSNEKIRIATDMSQIKSQMIPPAGMKQLGIDQKVVVRRPDLQASYIIFPRLKSYFKEQIPKDENAKAIGEPRVTKTELEKEEVDGHPCVKTKVVITTSDGESHEILFWFATDLRNFPARTQMTVDGNIEISNYKDVKFVKPDAKRFEVPAGFTAYTNFEELMEKTEGHPPLDVGDATLPSAADEKLSQLIAFTLQKGTNRPFGSNTVNGFSLESDKIPAMQLILARKNETTVHFFGVSIRSTNDLFVARVDRVTRKGTIWRTSPIGDIRGTVLTSTNGPPEQVSKERFANEFEEEINFFLEATAPPPWEDAPHPLNVVAKFGSVAEVEKVLKLNGKFINKQDDEGMTPLANAVVQEQVEVVQLLLDSGADPNIPDKNGGTPLGHACGRSKNSALPLARLLLAKGAEVNPTHKTEYRITPLEWAVSSDNTDLVKLLLEHGADAKASNDNGDTVLHTAADRGDTEIAELFIAHGADVNAKITGGTTPLHKAAWAGRDEVVKLLLSKGADVNAKRVDGLTPLVSAADREHNSTVEILLAKGADLGGIDEYGNTALHCAVARGNATVTETLLTHGAELNVKNKAGKTPMDIAADGKYPAVLEVLRKHTTK